MKEAAELAESTQILLNVSEFTDVSAATDSLISTVQAFKYTAEESMGVVDILNTIGNNYAISTSDLARSLTKSSSALVAAGGTLEEAVALTAAANTTIQDADVVGTALKTISMRLRGTSISEMEEEGLETEGFTTQSKLRGTVKSVTGIDILTDTGAYKSTYQILSEIAEVWDDIKDDQAKAGLLEALAGKRSGSVVAAILQNPDALKNAFESASSAQGSAQAELEKYMDSIQGRLDQFTNALQTMWNNILDDDLIKFIVSAGTELLKVIDNLGVVKTLVIGIGTYLIQKNFKGDLWGGLFNAQSVDEARNRLKTLKSEIDALKGAKNTNRNQKKITKKQEQADALGASIDKYDELTATLQKNRIEANAAKEALDKYDEKIAKKYAKKKNQGKSPTDQETAERQRLNAAYQKSQEEITKTETALQQAEIQAKATGTAGLNAGNKIKTGFVNGAKAVWKFTKEMAMSMAYTMAITAIFEALGNIWNGLTPLFDKMVETPEELQEKLSELQNELSSVESELDSLQSELKDTDKRIEELMDQGSLTFVEQEELNKLKSVSAELKSQIALQETLQKSLQQSANSASIEATDAYLDTSFMSEKSKTERQEEAKETGSAIGQIAGTIIGGIIGTVIGGGITLASGGTAAVPGAAIGIAAGSAIAGWIGGEAGSALAGSSYDSEESVEEAMDSMLETRKKLKQSQSDALAKNDAEAYNEATEALRTYDSQMAKHISQIQQNYNAMDWEIADPETRKEMIEYADWLDKYNISMGTEGAKSNAIARIFGDEATDNIARARDEINRLKSNLTEAKKSGEGVDEALAALESFKLDFLSDEEIERLYQMGIYLYEIEDYFKDVTKAESEFVDVGLYDVATDINRITEGLESLKSAFDEIIERGSVTAKTITDLHTKFKEFNETEDGAKAWLDYSNTVFSGASSIEQMTQATEEYVKQYLDYELKENNLNPESKWTYIVQLQGLGVENAQEYVEEMLGKNMTKDIQDTMARNIGILFRGEKERIAERYGVEAEAVEEVAEKVRDLTRAKNKLSDVEDKQDKYDEVETLYERAKRDLDNAKKGVDTRVGDVGTYTDTYKDEDGLIHYGGYYYNGKYYDDPDTLVKVVDEDALYIAQQAYDAVKEKYADYFDEKGNLKTDIPAQIKIEIEEAENAVKEAENAINDLSPELQLKLNLQNFDESVDKIQDTYSTLKNIATEYNTQGYLSLDNLQALLNMSPEYLACLQMENGQLTINQNALQSMLETKLDDAKATAVQTAITQLNALAERKQAIEISNSAVAANQASIELGTYSGALGTVAQDAIVAAGSAAAFNAALQGAQGNTFVSEDEINQVLDNFNNSVNLIDSVRANRSSNFNNVLDPGSKTSPEEVADDKFQKDMDYWENRIAANKAKYDQLQNEIDLMEQKGQKADASFYNEQINLENERLWLLEQQKAAAEAHLATLTEGSEEWWEVAGTLNGIESEIDDVTASIVDLQDAIGDIDIYKFDEFNNRLDNLTSKLGTIRDLIAPNGEDDWFDDEGNWTEDGVAVLGTYVQELETYKNGLAETQNELAKYSEPYEGNEDYYASLGIHSEQEYYDKVEGLTNQQYDYMSSISDTEQSIVGMYESGIDAVEEYTETLIDGYNDYIDSVKEALDAERDLFEFKKNVQKQTKDIAVLERRIASLSGSTNAADIAERRKLEAQLYESRESLNDTYYDHAKESQQNALDAEASAYEETMTKMVEGMRTSLEEATSDMETFLDGVTTLVALNAGVILTEYENTGLKLDPALTTPWVNAKNAVGDYSNNALDLMNDWAKNGFLTTFSNTVGDSLTSPWNAGKNAVDTFKNNVTTAMSNIVSTVESNVKKAKNSLASLTSVITTTTVKADGSVGGDYSGNNGGYTTGSYSASMHDGGKNTTRIAVGKESTIPSTKTKEVNGQQYYLRTDGYYYPTSKYKFLYYDYDERGKSTSVYGFPAGTQRYSYYAKGTTGTPHDQLAIVDELGPELILHANPETGRLEYLTKGSGVIPHDATVELMKFADVGFDGFMDANKFGANINMINNAVNKPEFNFTFDALVKAENITEETLPAVKKLVTQELNRFTKELNYALKGKGAR